MSVRNSASHSYNLFLFYFYFYFLKYLSFLLSKLVGGSSLVDGFGALVRHWTLRCFAAVVVLYFEIFSHCDYS